MTGTSYKRSAELAGVVGPYDGYARNADAHKRVMRKHQAANDADPHPRRRSTRDVHKLRHQGVGRRASRSARSNGFRNAQASVLAPTGTIGFMMDCDTTGIEPDFSLVKFKKLVGGGSMQIVNQTIPRALRKLGYQPRRQVEAIVEYIAEHGHVIDAPGLKPEHYEVFDCAMGARSIAPMGHVRMMAAVPAVPVRRDLQDGQPARDGHGRGDRGRLPAGLEARPQGARRSTATTARSASRCPTARPTAEDDDGRRPPTPSRREGRRVPARPASGCRSAARRRPRRSPSAAPRAT